MFLDFKVVRSTGIARAIYCLEAILYLFRIVKSVKARSSKYPVFETIYYALLGYAVVNSFLAELPSNTHRSNEWASPRSNIILTIHECVRLLTNGDLTGLSYNALLLFVQEK